MRSTAPFEKVRWGRRNGALHWLISVGAADIPLSSVVRQVALKVPASRCREEVGGARWTCAVCLVILFSSPFAGVGAAKFGFAPEVACDFMLEEGLRTRGGYRQIGMGYECRSQRRNAMGGGPVNNTIRFSARGDAQRVTELELDLRVNAQGAVQRTHGVLVNHANALFQRALDTAMTDEIESAIRSGTAGQWLVGGRTVILERVPPGAQRYGLRLRIH